MLYMYINYVITLYYEMLKKGIIYAETIHYHCCMHCTFSIGLRFVWRPWIDQSVTAP